MESDTKRLTDFGMIALLVALVAVMVIPLSSAAADEGASTSYEVKAENAFLTRVVTGDVTDEIQGIPAAPVDSFAWGGGSVRLEAGTAKLEVDPVNNTGEIKAEWTDPDGNEWTYEQTAFFAPDHASGLQVGPGADSTLLVEGDPIPTNVYLHGDTTAGGPVLPTHFNYVATWGPATVTLNGQPFENPYDGPTPQWVGHTMTTVGVRNEAGEVWADDTGTIYSPMNAAAGYVENDDLEFHIVFHDAGGPEMTANFPPPLSFFYHLTFEDVQLEIQHAQ